LGGAVTEQHHLTTEFDPKISLLNAVDITKSNAEIENDLEKYIHQNLKK
jgi:hypothetical protein